MFCLATFNTSCMRSKIWCDEESCKVLEFWVHLNKAIMFLLVHWELWLLRTASVCIGILDITNLLSLLDSEDTMLYWSYLLPLSLCSLNVLYLSMRNASEIVAICFVSDLARINILLIQLPFSFECNFYIHLIECLYDGIYFLICSISPSNIIWICSYDVELD